MTEQLAVGKREVESGRVRVTKTVHEHEESIRQPLLHDEVEIERVPINRTIEQPMEPRYEGDVLVIPMIEEVAVVHKQLVLKEELRIRKRSVETTHEARVVLREEQANIERLTRENLKGVA
ncbi:MAG: YsnF/AvaK domain-containing protein [Burkholderiales bacterium]